MLHIPYVCGELASGTEAADLLWSTEIQPLPSAFPKFKMERRGKKGREGRKERRKKIKEVNRKNKIKQKNMIEGKSE